MIPYSSGTTWVRPWNYYGLANGSTTTVAGNTDEEDTDEYSNQGIEEYQAED